MVLTTTMVFAQTDGIEMVLLNHTCTRGPSVTRMQDFFDILSLCCVVPVSTGWLVYFQSYIIFRTQMAQHELIGSEASTKALNFENCAKNITIVKTN